MTLKQHSAPGPNAGFIYQFERALWWLAESPAGFVIGIETDDDVSVVGSDGSRLLEQDKSSIVKNHKPFGDRSIDLWKTLANWVSALDAGEVRPETTRFLMVTNKFVPDCIARHISNANSDEEIATCILRLEAAAKEPPKSVAPFMGRVMRTDSRSKLRLLIKHCELIDSSGRADGNDLRSDTIAHLQLPQGFLIHADSIADELLGWLHKSVLNAWHQNLSAWVRRDHFVNQLYAIIDRRRRQIRRERAEHLIPVTDESVGKEQGSPFVKQIHLVTDDNSFADMAIRDYVRCNVEKIRLSREGIITDNDWIDFETSLQSRWERIKGRVLRMSKDKEEEIVGFEILTTTTEDYREKLAGSDTEQIYLTAGTYHRLANLIRLGWHPRFQEIMGKNEEMA